MKVGIFENLNKALIYSTEINLQGLNYQTSSIEYFNEAWRAAVEDGSAKEEEREKYTFEFLGN